MQSLIRLRGAWPAAVLSAAGLLFAPAVAAGVAPPAPRVVNVTTDSAPGWLPTVEQERQARQTATDFMAAMDGGRYADAYGFLAEIDRPDQPFAAFAERLRQFNANAGAVLERRLVTVTWTDNPAQAPMPGVYVAIDLVSRFVNVDRHCGYLVLYQAPSGGAFQVMRQEDNFLDNAQAAAIAKGQSSAAVEAVWAQVSAHCPGYAKGGSQPAAAAPVAQSAPLPETSASTIGYPTVDAALAGLHAKPGVVFSTRGGWTIASDAATETFWSFPPPGYPAYPAAVKRQLAQKDGAVTLQMTVMCGASKQACDDLVRTFEQLNAQMTASMRGSKGGGPSGGQDR